jgi:hypothetical protein
MKSPLVAVDKWLVVFVVMIVAAVIGTGFILAGPLDEKNGTINSALYNCKDPVLSKATVSTRFQASALEDRPMFRTETEVHLGSEWPGLTGLTQSASSPNFTRAIECLFPAASRAYRTSAPAVAIESGRATVRDTVGYRYEDQHIPADLGVWRLEYGTASTHDCSSSAPERQVQRSVLVVLCPPEGIRDAVWDVTVDLHGFALANSSQVPEKYESATSASWKLSGPDNAPLWLELQPSWSTDIYFTLAYWLNGSMITFFWMAAWIFFFSLILFFSCRYAYAGKSTTPGRKVPAKSVLVSVHHLIMICMLALVVCVAVIVVDTLYNLGETKEPSILSERVWAVIVFSAVALFYGFTLRRRLAVILFSVVTAISIVLYFGPRIITLETSNVDETASSLSGIMRLGYFSHIGLGILLVWAVVTVLLKLLSALMGLIGLQGAVRVAFERPVVRCVIGLLVGIMVIGQWVLVRGQWDDRFALVPGRLRSFADVRDQLLSDLPWIPDLLGHWLPLAFYYAALLSGFAVLARDAATEHRSLAAVPASDIKPFIMLFFAAAVVGTAGEYRGIVFPLQFLIALVLLWPLGRRTPRLDHPLFADIPLGKPQVLEGVQWQLLETSKRAVTEQRRNEALERQYEKGEPTPTMSVHESIFRRFVELLPRKSEPTHGLADSSSRDNHWQLTDQEQALALGPFADWWRNALYAARTGFLLAIPVIAYDSFVALDSGMVLDWFVDQAGTIAAVSWVVGEVSLWLIASFTLGALWPLIPGRRGFHKGVVLGIIPSTAVGVDFLVFQALGEGPWDAARFVLLFCSYLAVVGIIIDLKTLKKIERQRWEFVDYLRLRDTRWLAAYGLTALTLSNVVFTQVSEGKPLTSIPLSLLSAVTRGAG